MPPADIAKLAAPVAATIAVTLLWIRCSRQQRVDRSALNSTKVALRLLAVHAAVIYVLCIVGHMPVDYYLVLTAVVYFVAVVGPVGPTSTDELVGFAFLMALLIPAYVLKQFVLGFPDRDQVILTPPKFARSTDPPPRKSDTGTVVATLRPMGRIELAGEEFNAVSDLGKLIDVGVSIRVTGHRGDAFLVRELDAAAR